MSNTNTQRTRLEWFSMFPEPYRQQAMDNYDENYNGCNGQSLFDAPHEALADGFSPLTSPQGFDYWAKFHDKLWRKN